MRVQDHGVGSGENYLDRWGYFTDWNSHANPLIIHIYLDCRLCIHVFRHKAGSVYEGIQATTGGGSRAGAQTMPLVSHCSPIRSGRNIFHTTGTTGSHSSNACGALPLTLGCGAMATVEKLSLGHPTRRTPCEVTLRQAVAQCKVARGDLRPGQFFARGRLHSNSCCDTRFSPATECLDSTYHHHVDLLHPFRLASGAQECGLTGRSTGAPSARCPDNSTIESLWSPYEPTF
jgi:hypothetical protein